MIDIVVILIIIWMHWIADFVFQSNRVATEKSSDNNVLAAHVIIYAIPFLYFGFLFALVNMVAHFLTDYVTSRTTKKLYKEGKIHDFFVVIGLDQAIHMSTLMLTYWWLVV